MSLNSAAPVTSTAPMSLSDLVTDNSVKREASELSDSEDGISGHTAIKRHTIDAILGLPRLPNGFRHYPGEHLNGQLRDNDLCGDGTSYSESDDLADKVKDGSLKSWAENAKTKLGGKHITLMVYNYNAYLILQTLVKQLLELKKLLKI